jgi:hypothetical protein
MGLLDRRGKRSRQEGCGIELAPDFLVFDVDGTREAARQRALPQTPDRPPAQRRLRPLCAPGYTGRKRGEVVRARTVVSQAHSYQWLGSFGNQGLGHYREELRRAVAAIHSYLAAYQFPQECARLAAGWALWHGSGSRRSSWSLLCDALAVTISCWIEPRSRLVCTCPQTGRSLARKVS